jgi:hypothetical protein
VVLVVPMSRKFKRENAVPRSRKQLPRDTVCREGSKSGSGPHIMSWVQIGTINSVPQNNTISHISISHTTSAEGDDGNAAIVYSQVLSDSQPDTATRL